MKRITFSDHWRIAQPIGIVFAVAVGLLLSIVWIRSETIDLMSLGIPFALVGLLYVFPIVLLHTQYWRHNRKTGVEFEGSSLRIYSDEVLVDTIELGNEVEIEKVVGSARKLPHDRYFYYCIRRKNDLEPIILTSLLVGECEKLNEIAEVHKVFLPDLDT